MFCIGNDHVAIEITNSERRIACWNIGIGEWESCRLENKVFVVRLNVAGVKVGHIKKIVIIGHAHCHAFVNCAGGAPGHRCECMRVIQVGIPARNHSVFADENELGGKRVYAVADVKEGCVVPDDTGWVCAFSVSCAPRNRDDEWIPKLGAGVPSSKYCVATPDPLSTTNIVPQSECARPHGFTTCASVNSPTPWTSDCRFSQSKPCACANPALMNNAAATNTKVLTGIMVGFIKNLLSSASIARGERQPAALCG